MQFELQPRNNKDVGKLVRYIYHSAVLVMNLYLPSPSDFVNYSVEVSSAMDVCSVAVMVTVTVHNFRKTVIHVLSIASTFYFF